MRRAVLIPLIARREHGHGNHYTLVISSC